MPKKRNTNKKNAHTPPGRGKQNKAKKRQVRPIRRELWAVICLLLTVISLLGCFGVKSWLTTGVNLLSRGLTGGGYVILPLSLLLAAVILMFHDGRPVRLRVTCAFLLAVTIGSLAHIFACKNPPQWGVFSMLKDLYAGGISGESGGAISGLIGMLLSEAISKIGAAFVLVVVLLLELMACMNMSISSLVRAIQQRPRLEYEAPKRKHADPAKVLVDKVADRQIQHQKEKIERRRAAEEFNIPVDDRPVEHPVERPAKKPVRSPDRFVLEESGQVTMETEDTSAISVPKMPEVVSPQVRAVLEEEPQKLNKEEVHQETLLVAQEIEENIPVEAPRYIYPPVDLLRSSDGKQVDGTEEMRMNSARLNDILNSFDIDAHITNVVRGPSVTRYELELDPGVRLSRLTSLADDIALSLGTSGVRISAIPDKVSVVGIEVPNKSVSMVLVRDVIATDSFTQSKSDLAFAVGRDISGTCVVGDVAKLPHLLISGTTGSGKSVCMNSLIVSLLYKSSPEQVRMIMVDPKMVELGVYNGIPHLLIPVVTDPKKAAGALQWAVCEMMRRYRMMADVGSKDLASYNKAAAGNPELETMPQVVVVIDELADLMLVAAKEVEESICRIAQMGRASGIHLIIATQRPSQKVITGLMKANIPSRIAFAVASAMESRIILDAQGAEKLVGKGDMLYAPLGQGKPRRVQGCFISEEEVQRVVDFVSRDATANYDSSVMAQIEENAKQSGSKAAGAPSSSEPQEADGQYDELLIQAVDVFMETGQGSVSVLQRRLKLGYARAARIVDEMEERGIVGPFSGSKPREILVTRKQWEAMKNGESNPGVEEELNDL